MQIRNRIIPIVLIIIVIIVSSCATGRHAATRYQTLSQRAQIIIEMNQQKYNVSSQVRVWRNEMTVISVQPMLGIEMVRIEATRDSIWAFDKINKRYVALSFKEIEQTIHRKFNYKTLQDFVSQPITDKKKMEMQFSLGKQQLKMTYKFSNREYNSLQAPSLTKKNKYKQVTLKEILSI